MDLMTQMNYYLLQGVGVFIFITNSMYLIECVLMVYRLRTTMKIFSTEESNVIVLPKKKKRKKRLVNLINIEHVPLCDALS